MVNRDKVIIGHSKVKELEGGIYENLALLRKALNKICLDNEFETPEELEIFNNMFEN